MALDLMLLRIVKKREDFYRVRGRIPDSAIDAQTRALMADYGKFFEKFPDAKEINFDEFLPMFRAWHTTLTDEQRATYEAILRNASKPVEDGTRSVIMREVLELRLATELANLAVQHEEGNIPNLFAQTRKIMDAFKADVGIKEGSYIDDDIDDLLRETASTEGVKWRLRCLNESMRPLQPGDFGIIAGRPDRGKTTFIASEITHMAGQLPMDQNVLWLNNEGPGKRIIPRLYSSALGVNRTMLMQLMEKRMLKEMYRRVMGRMDRIRVVDIHGKDNFSVEQEIEAHNAGIVIYDMIDNIRGFGDAARTDLGLERMYQWAREFAVSHGHIAMATSQISNDGDGMQFPTLGMLKDSKTGKQGACDFQIMIGASNDPGYENTRWIGTPKNKLRLDTGPSDPKAAVLYKPMIGRYADLDTITGDDNASDT